MDSGVREEPRLARLRSPRPAARFRAGESAGSSTDAFALRLAAFSPSARLSLRGRVCWLAVSSLLCAGLAAGCQRRQEAAASPEAPVIPVSHPVERKVGNYVYYTGRIDAVQAVDIRARVTGYLVKMPFKEGAEVKTGDLLFEIDPRPFQAQYDAAKAQVDLKEANYRLGRSINARSRAIARTQPGAISQEELERNETQEVQGLADLNLAKANLQAAKLNLDFTRVTSPIDGQVSRYYYTLGNLVAQDQTLLTTVVSVDPMYAFFDMDERTVLKIRRAINEGRLPQRTDTTEIPVNLGLEGDDGYPQHGTINFVNNTVNPSTGTITVRGVFANPRPANGRRLLTPGMFVRIQLPIGSPHPALLVIDRAIGSDQGVKFVYVIDPENRVEYRRVTLGPLQEDGLRAIEQGLKSDDWVVVGGLPQVRPRLAVQPDYVPMPVIDTSADRDGGPAASKASAPAAGKGAPASAPAPGGNEPAAPASAPASTPDAAKGAPSPAAPAPKAEPETEQPRPEPSKAATQAPKAAR